MNISSFANIRIESISLRQQIQLRLNKLYYQRFDNE